MAHRQMTFSIRFGPDLENLALGADLIAEFREKATVEQKIGDQIELAVGEGLANAIKHSQAHGDESIGLTLQVNGNFLTVIIDDNGIGFIPEEVPLPDFENHRPHGYGLFLMNEVMDSVVYDRTNGINTLTMKKQLES
ncbi:hypothetical protein GO013_07525 [Pseudodesulfovibrio sp. JC047]|uniref:ATP-binding protein n=1 Tax=Pseudodesulfovibrio sp. JC047 TaxID=2683199 RepID=UPI0013D792B6|nr:ATP-binding protein [Pseudodesulfovibrio sp. JC047]NDV19269.1 hypothetical protein [Pseudodesulfovibrio sp. JC047]